MKKLLISCLQDWDNGHRIIQNLLVLITILVIILVVCHLCPF